MVARAVEQPAARLLPRRGPGRAALLDLPPGGSRRRARRSARLVHPRTFWLMPEYTGFARKKLVLDGAAEALPRAPFVELGVTSPFSFLRGASDAIELVLRALELGMDAIGIADRNTLARVVRLHNARA